MSEYLLQKKLDWFKTIVIAHNPPKCAICYENYSVDFMWTYTCGCEFHYKCARKTESDQMCPKCRQHANSETFHRMYDADTILQVVGPYLTAIDWPIHHDLPQHADSSQQKERMKLKMNRSCHSNQSHVQWDARENEIQRNVSQNRVQYDVK